MSELPRGWVTTKMEAILATLDDGRLLSQGWSPRCHSESAQSEQDWAVLKTTAIQDGYFIPEENKKLPAEMTPRPNLEVRPGDLLITCAGPRRRCGIVCLVEATRGRLMISGKMYRFRVPERHVSSRYIAYFLRCGVTQEAIDGLKTGMSDSGLNLTHERFLGLPVLLAPFPEQRRIVAKIDSLSAKSRRARDHLDHIPRLVEKYKQSILAAAFRGELTAGRSERKALKDVCQIKSGFAFKSSDFKSQGDVPVVRIGDISDGEITFTDRSKYVDRKFLLSCSEFRVEQGDILVALSGATTGKSGVYRLQQPALLNQRVARLRVEQPFSADASLIAFFLQWISQDILAASYGGAQPNISSHKLGEFQLEWPAPNHRKEVVEKLQRAFAWIDRVASEAARSRKLLDHLNQSILSKAFRGELVPQDPNDEPASALLERIRAERISTARQRGMAMS